MNLHISRYSGKPLYAQLRDEVKRQILDGTFKPGDRIPTEEEICNQYKISRSVIKQAFTELVKDGYLERNTRNGTIVKDNQHTGFFKEIQSYNDETRRAGHKPKTVILSSNIIPATSSVAGELKITVGDPVIHIERLRSRDDLIIYYVDAYYNPVYLPKFNNYITDNCSFYDKMLEVYDIKVCTAHRTFEAISCDKKLANILKVKAHSAIMYVKSCEYDQFERLISYDESFYIGENSEFEVEIKTHK